MTLKHAAATRPAYLIIDGEPAVPMLGLETVWFQITGTLCNLRCAHCFVSCGPDNHTHGFMTLEQVRAGVEEGLQHGARAFGFTGGEPFMHPQIVEALGLALAHAPVLVLSNGTLFSAEMAQRLRALAASSPHLLDIRISIDSDDPQRHEALRGKGTFARALSGIRNLVEAGLRPSVATTETWDGVCEAEIVRRMRAVMASAGVDEASVKIFPPLLLGREEEHRRPYRAAERVTAKCVEGADPRGLMCSSSRLVTERGTWVCTLLANVEAAKMGETLGETLRPFKITHGPCYTCFTAGVRCTAD